MPNSVIGIVDNDILLSIFDRITSQIPLLSVLPMDRPLTVIRSASQVCRRWRSLMLASPCIWGRLIDLEAVYGWKKPKWMEEVARRSALAPLWIYGHVDEDPKDSTTREYFLQQLESWNRIEKLSVFIYLKDKKILDHLQMRFLSRAPMLKLFDVKFFPIPDSLFLDTLRPGSSQALFANDAPSLRVIRAGHIAYRLDSPWLSNIREIYPFPDHLTLEDIFVILQCTPVIERFGMHHRDVLWVQHPYSNISLPNLSSISLGTNLSVVAEMLNRITPGILSSFYVYAGDSSAEGLDQPFIMSSFKKHLPSYFSNYFGANAPTVLWLEINDRGFRLRDPPGLEVWIHVPFPDQRDWDDLAACLLDVITASSILQANPSLFESIIDLRMYHMELQTTLIPKLYSVLALLRRVRDIHTDEEYGHIFLALSYLDKANNDAGAQHVLFPQLHTLHLASTGLWDPRVLCTDLTPFFIRRKNIGFPVVKLDLTQCQRSNYAHDIRDLEAVGGLEVAWARKSIESSEEICSYICGTGQPEQLKSFTSIRRVWE